MKNINTPYVKHYENGIVTNPIKGSYKNPFPNRQARRQKFGRLFSNKKGVQITVTKIGALSFMKYRKVLDHHNGKTILHNVTK